MDYVKLIFVIGTIKILFYTFRYRKNIIFLNEIINNLEKIKNSKIDSSKRFEANNFLQLNSKKYFRLVKSHSSHNGFNLYNLIKSNLPLFLSKNPLYSNHDLARYCYAVIGDSKKYIGFYNELISKQQQKLVNPFAWLHSLIELFLDSLFAIFPFEVPSLFRKIITFLAEGITIFNFFVGTFPKFRYFIDNIDVIISKLF